MALNSSDIVNGVNETNLDNLVIEMIETVDDIKFLLGKIDMKIYDTNDYFKGNVADALRNKYEFFKRRSQVVLDNLSSYSNDLIAIKTSVKSNDRNINNAFETLTKEVTNAQKNM